MPRLPGLMVPRLARFAWSDAVVVVTGASRGIGRAVAVAAARRGARVGLLARSRPQLEEVLAECGGRGVAAVADLGSRAETAAALGLVARELGPVSVLIANAGVGAFGPFAGMDPDRIDQLVRVNLLGTAHAMRCVLPGMLDRRAGRVCVIASVAGRFGSPFEAVYAATKFAVVGLAEAVAVEAARDGVGVSIVDPGVVDTGFFEARGHPYSRRWPRPVGAERVAETVVRAVEAGRGEFFVPRSFRAAAVVKSLFPPLYRWGSHLGLDGLAR